MTDVHTPEQRRRNMSAVRSTNTRPEMVIRKGLHAMGFRFRLHHKKLPGHPDLVFPKYRVALFVHGCFWHGHECALFRWPITRAEFWKTKILRNREVDETATKELRKLGWRILIIWECVIKGVNRRPIEDVICEAADWIRSDFQTAEMVGSNSMIFQERDRG